VAVKSQYSSVTYHVRVYVLAMHSYSVPLHTVSIYRYWQYVTQHLQVSQRVPGATACLYRFASQVRRHRV